MIEDIKKVLCAHLCFGKKCHQGDGHQKLAVVLVNAFVLKLR